MLYTKFDINIAKEVWQEEAGEKEYEVCNAEFISLLNSGRSLDEIKQIIESNRPNILTNASEVSKRPSDDSNMDDPHKEAIDWCIDNGKLSASYWTESRSSLTDMLIREFSIDYAQEGWQEEARLEMRNECMTSFLSRLNSGRSIDEIKQKFEADMDALKLAKRAAEIANLHARFRGEL
jgi:hypothetical protein